jgi:acetoacetyl-CoA synthetase
MEDRLSEIWRHALQRDAVGVDEDFFDLGGDSLMAVGLFLEIERAFGIKLPITAIYDAPTIAAQAALIEGGTTPAASHLVLLKEGDETQPFFIVHGVGGTVIEFAGLGRAIESAHAVYAVQQRGLDGSDAPLDRVEAMAAAYVEAIRAKQPDGPYLLGGYSFGGVVAMEMARLLGPQNVARLVMIDAYAHPHTWPRAVRAQVRVRKLASRFRAALRDPLREARAFVARRTTDRATQINNWLGAVDPNLPPALKQARIAGDAALIAYTPRPYAGAATFIRAGKTGTVFPASAREVYKNLIARFEVQTTPGDHRSILVEHVGELGRRVSLALP